MSPPSVPNALRELEATRMRRALIRGCDLTSSPQRYRGTEMATTNPAVARMLYDALRKPFAVEAQREQRLLTAARIAATLPDPAICVQALESLEPPQWDWEALGLRVRCYRRAGHPRAAAEADFVQFMERETPLGASIPMPPPH